MNKTNFDNKLISVKRNPIHESLNLVDEKGNFIFGTFEKPLNKINMLDAKKPYNKFMTKYIKNSKLKNWEAVEVAFDEGFLCAASYQAGLIKFNILMFYDNKDKKVYNWQSYAKLSKKHSHDTLIDSFTSLKTINSNYYIKNNFEKGEATFKGQIKNKKNGEAIINVKLTSISDPSIVSIPFGKNQSLYTHKELFKVSGTFKFNGREYKSNERTLGIIDDHRGYYPKHMHYYWITGMGWTEINNKKQILGFNLTENQSINPYDYNENILWLENESYTLPPVKFSIKNNYWEIKDKDGYVNIKFKKIDSFTQKIKALIINVDYEAPFGCFEGYIKTQDGKKYDVSSLHSMGEDKYMKI